MASLPDATAAPVSSWRTATRSPRCAGAWMTRPRWSASRWRNANFFVHGQALGAYGIHGQKHGHDLGQGSRGKSDMSAFFSKAPCRYPYLSCRQPVRRVRPAHRCFLPAKRYTGHKTCPGRPRVPAFCPPSNQGEASRHPCQRHRVVRSNLCIVSVSAVAFFHSLNGKGQQYRASDKAHGTKAGHAAKNGDYQYKKRSLDSRCKKRGRSTRYPHQPPPQRPTGPAHGSHALARKPERKAERNHTMAVPITGMGATRVASKPQKRADARLQRQRQCRTICPGPQPPAQCPAKMPRNAR